MAAATMGTSGKSKKVAVTTPLKDDDDSKTQDTSGNKSGIDITPPQKFTTGDVEAEAEGEEDGERGQGKKKRKKRANKRNVAKLKEIRKDFMDRCVSPEYDRINRKQLSADVNLVNLKNFAEQDDAVYKNTRSRGKGKKGRGGRPMGPTTGWEHILAATQFGPPGAGPGPQMQMQGPPQHIPMRNESVSDR